MPANESHSKCASQVKMVSRSLKDFQFKLLHFPSKTVIDHCSCCRLHFSWKFCCNKRRQQLGSYPFNHWHWQQFVQCLKIILQAGCGTINTNVKKEKAPLFKFSYFSFATPWGRVAAAQGWKLAIFGQIKRNDPVLRPKWNQKKVKWDPHWTLKSSFIFQANECRKTKHSIEHCADCSVG